MALIKMLPHQINEIWGAVGPEIQKTVLPLADNSDAGMNRILSRLLSGELVLWIIAASPSPRLDQNTLYGHVMTMPVQDWATGSMNLLIYSLYSWQLIPDNVSHDGIATLREYGRSLGCKKIIGYTTEPRVVQLAQMTGFDTHCTFIERSVL